MKTWLPALGSLEAELIERYGEPDHKIVALSGLSGCGKGTHAAALQTALAIHGFKLPIYEGGGYFRQIARERGYAESRLEEFSQAVAASPALTAEIDTEIERRTLEAALKGSGIYVGRLTFATIGNWGYKIYLTVDPTVIANRIAADPTRPEYGQPAERIRAGIVARDVADISRYEKLYHIRYRELANRCDLKVDNGGPREKVSEQIIKAVSDLFK